MSINPTGVAIVVMVFVILLVVSLRKEGGWTEISSNFGIQSQPGWKETSKAWLIYALLVLGGVFLVRFFWGN